MFKKLLSTLCLALSLLPALAQPNAPDIVVSKDGKGAYSTIQEAVLSVRDYKPSRTTIYVKNGTYEEKLLIPANKCDITIIGQSQEGVIITHADYAKLNNMGTFNTWTVRIDGDGIRMENLTIENSAGPVGQAVALHVEGDKCEFAKLRILGHQDTLFNGRAGSRQYFKDCYIEGGTDFIFGPATVVMDDCTLHCKNESFITASSTPTTSKYGYVFRNCTITANDDVEKEYLGRPWREYAAVIWLNCQLPKCIRPEGWHNWGRTENEHTSRFAEYKSSGDGANTTDRVSWSRQLTDAEAADLTLENIFASQTNWTPGYGKN